MEKANKNNSINYESGASANDAVIDVTTSDSHTTAHNTVSKRPVPLVLRLLRVLFRYGGAAAPALAGRIAARMWFTPPRFRTPTRERDYEQSAMVATVQHNDQTISTWLWGETGPLVLLVHGWSGRGTQLGAFAQPLVAAGYRVLSFDAPAHGSSTGKQTNLYEVVDVMLALQQHYGDFHAVVTHSFGGMCLAYACQHGFQCNAIAMICPPQSAIGLVDKFASTLAIMNKSRTVMQQQIEQLFPRLVWPELDVGHNVAQLKIPGLVVHDEHDDDIPWQEGQAIARAWPGAEFIKTSGLGHRRILRDDWVIQQVVTFINSDKHA